MWLPIILLPVLWAVSPIDFKAQGLPAGAEAELGSPLMAEEAETLAVPPAYLPASRGALSTIRSRLPEASRCFHRLCDSLGFATMLLIVCLCSTLALEIIAVFACSIYILAAFGLNELLLHFA